MAVVQYKTPGVYVEELDAFPPSIVGVETAVPAFIGYTEKAEQSGRSVLKRAVRISSMVDYVAIFGGAVDYQFHVDPVPVTADDIRVATELKAATHEAVTTAKNEHDNLPTNAKQNDKDAAALKLKSATEAETAAGLQLAALQAAYDNSPYGIADKDAIQAETDAALIKDDLNSPDPTKNTKAKELKDKADGLREKATAAFNAVRPNASIGGKGFQVSVAKNLNFLLYNSLRLFYANGGGDCYIVSVGDYGTQIGFKALDEGLTQVADVVGPTMLVIPEAVTLTQDEYNKLIPNMLVQCRDKQDRVAIIDVWVDPSDIDVTKQDFEKAIADFRTRSLSRLTNEQLRYGMAYVPWLRTSIVDPVELDYSNFAEFKARRPGVLTWALLNESNRLYPDATPPVAPEKPPTWAPNGLPKEIAFTTKTKQISDQFFGHAMDPDNEKDPAKKEAARKKINQGLVAQIPALKDLYATMAHILGILPASPAMAGVYTQNDALRGVWNAPANVGLATVLGPTIPITNDMQNDLNMPIDGLAVNAIRDFVGRGTLVWGARTLDGNSNDWRYIQVRRALIYIEQSVELALNKFVFAPNVAQTWVTVSSMISSFLRGVWQAGGLMGASPTEAFSVQCGLGSTMTAQDVLEGRMIVQIKLTMVHPAEFIVLTFQQQMQGGAG
jgi:phage tail sheath protein FI